VGALDEAGMAVAGVRLQLRRPGRVQGRPGPKKNWERGKKVGREEQRARGGGKGTRVEIDTLVNSVDDDSQEERRQGELRATAIATGNGYLRLPKNSCRRFLRVSGTGGRGPMAIF